MSAVGLLLLFMALSSAHVQRLPVSTSFIYLVVGFAVGPAGFDLLRIDVDKQRHWFELLTQIALVVSLFVGGLKLRLPLNHPSWRPAFWLAGPVMLASIAGTAAAAHWLLGMPVLLALLVGAALAPTDPVLASAVSVNDSADHDRVRFALSGEAGLNDGMAFPFVLLALEAMRVGGLGSWVWAWGLPRLLWGIPAALLIGYALGRRVGRLAIALRSRHRDTAAPSDFLALALIALSYVIAERLHSFGFLATFAAGVGLRHAELHVVTESPLPERFQRQFRNWFGRAGAEPHRPVSSAVPHPPAESMVPSVVDADAMEQPAIAAGVLISEALSFGDTVERLLEVLLVVMVGIMLADIWSWPALLLAGVLFLVIRPLATWLLLRFTRITRAQRRLLGWFGIRGIGSLFYVAYALNHGLSGSAAVMLLNTVVTVIAASVAVHGITVTPILARYERSLQPTR
jgi:NhaP-type Na+/H+ or K+/H+ antiporter